MKTMSALDAKNSFGQFIETAQREPVTVTKNRREVGGMFSMEAIRTMASAYLSPPIQERVASGEMNAMDALLQQAKMNEGITKSLEDVANGKVQVMDANYFDGLRNYVKSLT